MRLTDTAIKALEPGQIARDDLVKGLHVKSSTRGTRTFYLYFRTYSGIERRPKLGDYGIITIAEAREIARKHLAAVAKGEDPVDAKAKARIEADMNALWAKCEADIYNRGRKWDREAERLYRVHVKARLGGHRVRSVSYDAVAGLHRALAKRPIQANRAVAVVGRMFAHAERLGWRDVGSNPALLVERYPELKRRRYAKPEEIAKIGPLLDAEAEKNPEAVAFLYLLAYSGARPSEIVKAMPAQLERVIHNGKVFGVLRIHGKTTDVTGHLGTVFLPPQAMRHVDRLPAGGVYCSTVNAKTITGLAEMPKKVWNRVRKAAGCPDLWARDWRRTFATVGFSGGENKHLIGGLLNHRSVQTTDIYAKLMEDPAMAAAARIADRMEKLLTPIDPFAD